MAVSNQRFIRPELLARLANMELRVRTVVEGMMSGLHRSPFRGLSIEFAEYRRYQPGDEPSKIDWRVFARSDRYYIKEFEDETSLEATIILDASASMGFGSGAMTKWQYAGILAASLAYVLQRQNDATGLIVLDEEIRLEIPPRGTRGHLVHLIGELESTIPARQTGLAKALHDAAAKIKRRGLVIVISDLLDEPDEVISGLQHLCFNGNEVIVLHTMDPAEISFQFEGPVVFTDPETRAQVTTLAEQVKPGYLEEIGRFFDRYSEEMGKSNIAYTLVNTEEALDRALLALLGERMKD